MATALVTGGNRGIGLAVCRALAQKGISVVLAARDENSGKSAVETLAGEGITVRFCELDVTDEKSIAAAAAFVEEEFGRLDILVNNAGILLDLNESALSVSGEDVEETFRVNALGPLLVSQRFAKLMREGSRIVNVSSGYGQLSRLDDIEEASCPAYRISKCALNMVTRLLAHSMKGVLVNAACPGWVRTRMGGAEADRSPEEGAETIVWLATSPEVKGSGGFFRDMKRIDW